MTEISEKAFSKQPQRFPKYIYFNGYICNESLKIPDVIGLSVTLCQIIYDAIVYIAKPGTIAV